MGNDAHKLTITASITPLANYDTRTEVYTVFTSYCSRPYLHAEFSTNADVANVYGRTQLYTHIETNTLLGNTQHNISTLLGYDATTFHILNGAKVNALREGSNIQMSVFKRWIQDGQRRSN